MKVIRATHAGACYGVQRALDMAYAAIIDGDKAYTLGPLIHNPQVVSELSVRGVQVANEVDDISEGIVIIRSHGVTPDVRARVEARGLPLVDATCPHVALAQKAAAELAEEGCCVVVVGEAGHPEVEALTACASQAGARVHIVASVAELPDDLESPVGIVVQTTQTRENLNDIVQTLEKRGLELHLKNTICFATRQRQDAAAELAAEVDALVVIGGRNSSNTTRLAEICAAVCPRVYHVETPEEIDASWFYGCDVVGVTAGASTPEEQINAVELYLKSL